MSSVALQLSILPAWIAGVTDAEGCFYVSIVRCASYRLGFRVAVSFSISQSSDNLSVLQPIQSVLQCGYITAPRLRNSRKLMQEYRVVAIHSCIDKVIPFLKQNVLLTSKKHDFEAFCEVVYMCNRKEHVTQSGIDRIAKIKQV